MQISKNDNFTYLVYFSIGFSTVISQVIFLREIMVYFYGNELSVSFVLATWLIWIASGSILFESVFKNRKIFQRLIILFLIINALIIPFTLYAIRTFKSFITIVPGELPDLMHSLIGIVFLLGPICFISGAFFTLAANYHSNDEGYATSTVYKFEAIGSATGGLLLSYVLLGNLNSFQILLFISFINILLAFAFMWDELSKIVKMILVVLLFGFVVLSGNFGKKLHLETTIEYWKNYKFLESRDSKYGHLSVIQIEDEKSIYSNSTKIMSSSDIEYYEEIVHYTLLQHPLPENVLIIGSIHPAVFKEVLKHRSIKKIDNIQLDQEVFTLSKKYFNDQKFNTKQKYIINKIVGDGRQYLKETKNSYDIIISLIGDPINANINRFYTVEYFNEVKEKLNQNGILYFQLSSSEYYINAELTHFLKIIYKSIKLVFDYVKIIPGDDIHFFASKSDVLILETDTLVSRLKERQIINKYVNKYYLKQQLLISKIKEIESLIFPDKSTIENRDFRPIAYFVNLTFWSSQFSTIFSSMFQRVSIIPYAIYISIFVFPLIGWFIWNIIKKNKVKLTNGNMKAAVLILGMSLITIELIIILGFQAIYGYIYQYIAALIGLFMAGIAVGSTISLKKKFRVDSFLNILIILHLVIAVLPFCIMLIYFLDLFINKFLIFAFSLICGLTGGYHFVLASRTYFSDNKKSHTNMGILYGLDMSGALIGTIILGLLFIPLFGFIKTALLICFLNIIMAVFLWIINFKLIDQN